MRSMVNARRFESCIVYLLSSTIALATSGAMQQSASAQRNQDPDAYYRAPNGLHGKTVLLPIGTTFEGRMDTTIGSAHSRAGQRFTISMATPVLANGTDVIIPAGSEIMGEVVEAISSGKLPHEKGTPKPCGKLRVSLSGLHTPDGMNYPMVASLIGEVVRQGRRVVSSARTAGGVAYVGNDASFQAVAPGVEDRARGHGGGPKVQRRGDFARDPLYGFDEIDRSRERVRGAQIRSLVRKKNDLFIYQGSPVSVRLDAPFKIAIAPTPTAGASFSTQYIDPAQRGGGRRFSQSGGESEAAPAGGSTSNSPLPFLGPKGGSTQPNPNDGEAPQGTQQGTGQTPVGQAEGKAPGSDF